MHLVFNRVKVKNRSLTRVNLNPARHFGHQIIGKLTHQRVGFMRINSDFLDVVSGKITNDPKRKWQVCMNKLGPFCTCHLLFNLPPTAIEKLDVFPKLNFLLEFGDRSNNKPRFHGLLVNRRVERGQ